MRTSSLLACCLAALSSLGTATVSWGADEGITFKFPVGFSYVNGAYDLNDKLKDSYREGGYNVSDNFVLPVGLTFNPRVEFPFGLGIGVALGPTEFIAVERESYYYGYDYYHHPDDTELNYVIPVGGYVQYNLFRDRTVSPFVRVGVRYPITGGDNIKSSSVGFFGSGGVEFLRDKKVAFGIEAGYDTSEIKVNANLGGPDKKVTPIGFNIGIFVLF